MEIGIEWKNTMISTCHPALPTRLIELGRIVVVNSKKTPGSSFEA
jgi:hypothetical protein